MSAIVIKDNKFKERKKIMGIFMTLAVATVICVATVSFGAYIGMKL